MQPDTLVTCPYFGVLLCAGHRTPAARSIVLNGPLDEVLVKAVEDEVIGILAFQLPPGSKGLQTHQMNLLRRCKGAVLFYQEATASDHSRRQ